MRLAWQDATADLQRALPAMLDRQKAAEFERVIRRTGKDVYAARVRLENIGTTPISVVPGKFIIHVGDESVRAATLDLPGFLHPCLVRPGEHADGLITYQLRVDAGPTIRLGGGRLSYDDGTVQLE